MALKEVYPVDLHRQSGIHALEILTFKIAPHKQKSIVNKFFGRKMGPLANGTLYLSTPKHNGKSGTVHSYVGNMPANMPDIDISYWFN